MWHFCFSTLLAGLRSRAVQTILVVGALLVGVAYLASSFTLRQPKTVALDVGLSGVRFSLALLAIYWIQDLIAKEIERRTAAYALSYPVSRGSYLLGRYLGVLGLLALASMLLGMLLWLAVLVAVSEYQQTLPPNLGFPYWMTILGLWIDVAVIAGFCTWIASVSTIPILPVALGAAFAVAGKSLGAVADYLAGGADGLTETANTYGPIVDVIRWVLPDLSRLDWRAWPMYGVQPAADALIYAVLMAVAYTTALLALAVFAFNRREFA